MTPTNKRNDLVLFEKSNYCTTSQSKKQFDLLRKSFRKSCRIATEDSH